jgi:hypothetical protein
VLPTRWLPEPLRSRPNPLAWDLLQVHVPPKLGFKKRLFENIQRILDALDIKRGIHAHVYRDPLTSVFNMRYIIIFGYTARRLRAFGRFELWASPMYYLTMALGGLPDVDTAVYKGLRLVPSN